jgi:Subtilase family
VSMGLSRRAKAAVAVGLALAPLALASSPALADQVRNHEWWLAKLHVSAAWQSSRGTGVTVAVLDTGVASTQPDLVGSVISGPDYTNSGRAPGGLFWGSHGTAIASIIAGHGHGSGAGIMGVAPQAKILSIRVTLESRDPLMADPSVAGKLPFAIAKGIRFAVSHGATVIDLPLDPLTKPGSSVAAGAMDAERAAVSYALARRIILVAPAGDDGAAADRNNYPAAYPGVISVGAFNSQFVKAKYSSHHSYVTVTAAGDGVIAASTRGYTTLHSTSAASAVVAGIAALIRAQFPTLTPIQVTRVLASSTVYRPPGGKERGSGSGTVDAASALAAAAQMVEVVPSTPAGAAGVAPPSPPNVYSLNGSFRKTLALDVAISVAVFVVLLIFILLFRRLGRRRARSARLAEVRAAARVQARRSKEATTAGGAGFLPAAPGRPRSPAAGSLFAGSGLPGTGLPSAGSRPALPAGSGWSGGQGPGMHGTGTPASRPPWGGASSVLPENMPSAGADPSGTEPPRGSRPQTPGAFGGPAAGLGLGSLRGSGARAPQVSGSPPWEPAEKPDSELPWVQSRVRAAGATRSMPAPPPEPQEKSWDSIAEEVWPGGPGSAAPHPPAKPPASSYTPSAPSGPPRGQPGTATPEPLPGWREQVGREQPASWDSGLTAAGFGASGPGSPTRAAGEMPSWETAGSHQPRSPESGSYQPGPSASPGVSGASGPPGAFGAPAAPAGGYQSAPASEPGSYDAGAGGYPPSEPFEADTPYPWHTSGDSTAERRTPPRGPHGESTEIFPTVGPPESGDPAQ